MTDEKSAYRASGPQHSEASEIAASDNGTACQHVTPINGCEACWTRVMKELAGCASTLSRLHEAVRALFDSAKHGGWDKAVTDLSEAYNAVHQWARDTNRLSGNPAEESS